jgi:hypothetical protein
MKTSTHKRRTGLAIGGAIVGLVAAVVLAVGGVAIWTDVAKRDASGYLSTNAHRYATPTRAIATEEVTVGTEVPKRLVGDVRLKVSSAKPVFVGIARKSAVDAYLAGTSYTTAKDIDFDPFAVTYVTHRGSANPGRPTARNVWAATAVGTDAVHLTWKPKSGSWSVVVMNADGSPGVSADVSAGVKVPALLWTGIGLAIFGGLLLAVAARMLVIGLRGPEASAAGVAPVPAH